MLECLEIVEMCTLQVLECLEIVRFAGTFSIPLTHRRRNASHVQFLECKTERKADIQEQLGLLTIVRDMYLIERHREID